MCKELEVKFMPASSTELIDEFYYEDYERLILTTEKHWINGDYKNTNDIYKVFFIICKESIKRESDELLDIDFDKYVPFSYFYRELDEEYPEIFVNSSYVDYKKIRHNLPTNTSVTFTELKKGEYGSLWFLIARTLYANKDAISKNEEIDIYFRASFGLDAKGKKDKGFDGSFAYWEGGFPKMKYFRINGIRLIQCKRRPEVVRNHFNAPEEIIFPEKYYKCIKSRR